jgi:hypothetical protein
MLPPPSERLARQVSHDLSGELSVFAALTAEQKKRLIEALDGYLVAL